MVIRTPLAVIALLVASWSSLVHASIKQVIVCPGGGKPCENITIISQTSGQSTEASDRADTVSIDTI